MLVNDMLLPLFFLCVESSFFNWFSSSKQDDATAEIQDEVSCPCVCIVLYIFVLSMLNRITYEPNLFHYVGGRDYQGGLLASPLNFFQQCNFANLGRFL